MMKSKSTSRTAFFKLRASIIAVFCLTSVSVALVGSGAFSVGVFAQTNTVKANSFTPEGCFWSPRPRHAYPIDQSSWRLLQRRQLLYRGWQYLRYSRL